jgi:3-oxoacyl-[acyl-carrier protein] reductase
LMMAEFARRKIERGHRWGRIINISTDAAATFPSEISYGASKHAMESYSRSAAVELGPYGITVNIASLGPIQTGWIAPDFERSIAAGTPLRRVGHPDDVADVLVFLASQQARWLTGQLIYIGGGWRMPQ